METLITINNQAVGRDKLARLVQYSSKALWYFIQQLRLSNLKTIEKFKRLENVFSTFRKVLRLGRFIESFYSISQSLKCPDQLLKFTSAYSKLAFGMYLFCDHIICLDKTGLLEIDPQKWYYMSSKYWLNALLASLVRDCYEVLKIVSQLKTLPTKSICNILYENHKDLLVDTAKNVFDVLLPMTALGYLKLSPGTVGLMGTASSILGLLPLVYPSLKLS